METTFPIRVQVSNCATINKTRCRRQTNSSAAPSAGLENQGLILPLAHNLTLAGRCRPGCDPRKHCRRGSPVASIYRRGTRRAGSSLARGYTGDPNRQSDLRRMRCIFQRVIRRIHAARLDLGNLASDRKHRITKAVQLGFCFRFRRLNHQRARNRPAHRWRVKAAIDQAFGNVVHASHQRYRQRGDI